MSPSHADVIIVRSPFNNHRRSCLMLVNVSNTKNDMKVDDGWGMISWSRCLIGKKRCILIFFVLFVSRTLNFFRSLNSLENERSWYLGRLAPTKWIDAIGTQWFPPNWKQLISMSIPSMKHLIGHVSLSNGRAVFLRFYVEQSLCSDIFNINNPLCMQIYLFSLDPVTTIVKPLKFWSPFNNKSWYSCTNWGSVAAFLVRYRNRAFFSSRTEKKCQP